MKKLIFLMLMSVLICCSVKSQTSSQLQTKDHYLLKSKHQKTAAWIMLGGGATTCFVVGGLVAAHGFFDLLSLQPDKADKNSGCRRC